MADLYARLSQKLDTGDSAGSTAPYDRLSAMLDAEEPAAGITTMDIMDMDADPRAIMLMVLRDPNRVDGVPRAAIEQRFGERISGLADTLRTLVSSGWLIELGEAPGQRYRVNFRTRRGNAGLWSVLNDRML